MSTRDYTGLAFPYSLQAARKFTHASHYPHNLYVVYICCTQPHNPYVTKSPGDPKNPTSHSCLGLENGSSDPCSPAKVQGLRFRGSEFKFWIYWLGAVG